jgi:hypothetical protein
LEFGALENTPGGEQTPKTKTMSRCTRAIETQIFQLNSFRHMTL